ncbi:DUF1269 domain-containing protein [Frigidibacter sp.]|uniref:DUF1269 domain-containing protein n=1 Tax=Frigidibacter sp. TaxID=2586418 RepID=UPI0027352554|nr:DUF1269 domain-containing protein [Frigidibacter sp.]MDP3342231.1 DUF1269 domain-containing protein [Frigidibacter sp.]
MNKIIVAILESEPAAFEGLSALKDLHRDGDITLYATAVIVKDKAGAVSLRQAVDEGPVGTAVGLLTGGLLGILGGPAGIAIGASLGGLTGSLFDLDQAGITATIIDDVSAALTPGKVALLAEADESWTTPVDSRLEALGGVVLRRLRSEVVEDQLLRESAEAQAELKALSDDLNQAIAEDEAAIRKDIEQVKKRIQVTQEQARARLDQVTAETEGRIAALQEQAKDANDRTKARIEKRIAAAKADLDARSAKLNQAWSLTKEALAA